MNENRLLLLLCISICSSFLGLYVFVEVQQWSQYKEYEKTPILSPSNPNYPNYPFSSADAVASALTSITNSPVITYYEY